MFKYFLIVFVFWCQCREYASARYKGVALETSANVFEEHASSQTNKTILSLSQISATLNSSEIAGEMRRKPNTATNGRTTYNVEVGQQTFYVFSEQEFKRFLSDIRRYDNNNNNNNTKLIPQGYVFTPGIGAHKLHFRSMSWEKARQACIREGGHLAIINFESEEELLLQMLQEKGVPLAWIGFVFEDGDWITVNGDSLESIGYTKWTTAYSNQPNCGFLRKEYGVQDSPCFFTHSFFCEIPV